jgi:DNA-binding beta-propeller fold protein YncE
MTPPARTWPGEPRTTATVLAVCIAAAVTAGTLRAQTARTGDSTTAPVMAVDHDHHSAVAFYIPEKDLLPESVAYDVRDGSFYVGSTRKGKIVRVDRNGDVHDFIAPRQDGLWMVIGIKIHPTRRVLWACSWNGENLEGFKADETRATGVFAFNLDSGKLIRRWALDAPGEVHAFNDLVLTRGNDAFVTHMFDGAAIYRIADASQKLEVFARPEGLKEPNGITITPDERTLFVAGADGILAIDRESGASRALQGTEGQSLGGIDGLHYYRGSLIGVHADSVCRHRLDEAMTRVVHTDVLELDHPLFDVLTTGVIVGDEFFYVANAQFGAVQADGTLLPMDRLNEPAILKLGLK